jgi:fibronectin type 3 domain-containing protein
VPNHEFNKLLYRAVYDDGVTLLGDLLNKANADLLTEFTGDELYEGYAKKNVEMFAWLGDPTMEIPIVGIFGPTNLAFIPIDTRTVHLSWTDRSADEEGFNVQVADSVDGPWENVETLPANTVEASYSGMYEAQGEFFRIEGFSPHGVGYSNAVYVQTLAAPPTEVVAAAQSTSEVLVSWSDNSSGEIAYRIWRKGPVDADFMEISTTEPDVVSFLDADLTESTEYIYAVEAVTFGGASPAAGNVPGLTLPAAPTGLTVLEADADGVDLSWTDVSAGEDGYSIFRKPFGNPGDWNSIGRTDADVEEYTDADVAEGTEYQYAVAAFNASGVGPLSDACYAMTPPAGPVALAAIPVSASQITLSWSDESALETAYSIMRSLDGTTWFDIAELPADAAIFTDSGMTEGQFARYRVFAMDDAGPSDGSNVAVSRTLPDRPTELQAAKSAQGIVLAWKDNSAAESGYRIERRAGSEAFAEIATVGADVTGYPDLTAADTETQYRVAAFHDYGSSEYSNIADSKVLPADDDAADDDAAGDNTDDTAASSGSDDKDDNEKSGCGC